MRLLPPAVVVEDDPRRAQVVTLLIRAAFGDVPLATVGDGVALARALRDEAVGLVVIRSGVQWAPLPETAGLLRELHADAALVVLVDDADVEAIETALAAGADGIVVADGRGLARLPDAIHAGVLRARRRRLSAGTDQPYRTLFRSMAVPALVAAPDGTILEANRALANLVGADGPESLVRRTVPDMLTDPAAREAWRSGLDGPAGSVDLEAMLATADDTQVTVRLRAWRVPAAGGGEATVHATLEPARATPDEAPAAEPSGRVPAEIEQLASAISHDLRQSLRIVDRSLEMLAESAGDRLEQAETEHVDRARSAADDLDRLLEGILRWARLPSAGGEMAPVPLDRVLDRVLDRLESERRERAATVAREPLPTVVADEGQMELLLQNLLDNALKFGGDEPPQVHVSAQRVEGAWQVSVRDAGIGIDPAAAERVFGLFQRQQPGPDAPGHGIGLAVCRRIVTGHGGRIWVDSRPGHGATFHFTLPDRGDRLSHGGTT